MGVFFDTVIVCSVTGIDPGRHGRRLRRAGGGGRPAAPGARHRRLGQAGPRPASRSPGSPSNTGQLIGVERELTEDDIELDERYHAGIYGIPDDATLDAMRLAARTEGMVTDPVYEGKSMAGLIDLSSAARSARSPPCCTPTSAASPR